MNKHFLWGALALLMVPGAALANSDEPAQLEQCGAFARVAPFCAESFEFDTRELLAIQIIAVTPSAETIEEWAKIHREQRRGVGFTTVNNEGEPVQTGRPVVTAVARVIAVPPSGNMEEAMLYQALVTPDTTSMMILLPAEGDFTGWSMYIIASEGKRAVTLAGQWVRLSGRHRDDGNLTLDLDRLPESRVTATTLVRRGDGSNAIESLQDTFVEHVLVRDRDGGTRVYSGLQYTFLPSSEGGMSVATAYTNCRTAGQRLVERGSLRVDTTAVVSAVATSGLSLVPQAFRNALALIRTSCR